jgi:hypothetical protein
VSSSVEVVCDQRGGFDGYQGAVVLGYTYAEIGWLVGRDWRTVKRYLEEGAQPVYNRKRMPSKLDSFKQLGCGSVSSGAWMGRRAWMGRIVSDYVVPKHGFTRFPPSPPAARGEREQQLVALTLLLRASLDAVKLTLEDRGPSPHGHELIEQRRQDRNQYFSQR